MTTKLRQENAMTTQLSTKLAALAVALMVNTMMIGGVAYLFSSQVHQLPSVSALAHTSSINSQAPRI
jgi:hypothetical protein